MAEIFNKLTFDSAKLNKPELLRELGCLVCDSTSIPFLDMDEKEANRAVSQKIEHCMKQGTIIGDFKYFAERFSDGTVELEDTDTLKTMVSKIMKNKSIIEKNINAMQ